MGHGREKKRDTIFQFRTKSNNLFLCISENVGALMFDIIASYNIRYNAAIFYTWVSWVSWGLPAFVVIGISSPSSSPESWREPPAPLQHAFWLKPFLNFSYWITKKEQMKYNLSIYQNYCGRAKRDHCLLFFIEYNARNGFFKPF